METRFGKLLALPCRDQMLSLSTARLAARKAKVVSTHCCWIQALSHSERSPRLQHLIGSCAGWKRLEACYLTLVFLNTPGIAI